MSTEIPISKSIGPPAGTVSWPVIFSAIRSPPQWFANAATTVIFLIMAFLLFLAAVAIIRLAIDLLGSDHQQASEAVKSLLPIAAAVIGLPLIIWRLVILNQQTQISELKTQIDREIYYTSIFAKSVELMGSVRESKSVGTDGNELTRSLPNIELRLGGLYSLERLLAESITDQKAIIETLCAYIRDNSPLEISESGAEAQKLFRGEHPPAATRRADVQAALTIIGRRTEYIRAREAAEHWRLDLRSTNLIGYDFSHLNFDRADFNSSFLNASNLIGGSFEWCSFRRVFLGSADLSDTSFRHSTFDACDVTKSKLASTDFRDATLISVDLRNANVTSIDVRATNLDEAFSSFLDYALERARADKITPYELIEFGSLAQLFKKATVDEKTSISQTVHDILILMAATSGRNQQA
jgi:uncharacterized protein YjbI with pentapeptide repeats